MITRLPSATPSPLAYDACPLSVDSPFLCIDILRQGFLSLDSHAQLTAGRAIKRELRERLIAELSAQPIDPSALVVEADETPRREPQARRTSG